MEIYWVERLDALKFLLVGALVLDVMFIFNAILGNIEKTCKDDSPVDILTKTIKSNKWALFILLVLTLGLIFVPGTREMYRILINC